MAFLLMGAVQIASIFPSRQRSTAVTMFSAAALPV